jgi:radical SAM protein with 4Fe4S-binding SPASM domain
MIPLTRNNELTGITSRDRFDECPGDVIDPVGKSRWAAFRVAYHKAQALEEFTPFPLQLDFELTSQCNLKCSFCIHGQETIAKRELTFERFARAIDEGQRYGLCSVKLNYINEPLLTRNIEDYIRYAKSHGVLNVYFATNGILLTERIRDMLIDASVSKIMVSLDATTSETFEKMRHSKQFNLIVHNVIALIQRRNALGLTWPLVRVNFVKTPLNIHEAEAFDAAWRTVADMVGFQEQVGLPGADNTLFLEAGDHSTFRCSFPFKMLVIDSAGHILPCCTFSGREMPLGHVDDVTLADAWNGDAMRALKLSHQQNAWRSNAVCVRCVRGCA